MRDINAIIFELELICEYDSKERTAELLKDTVAMLKTLRDIAAAVYELDWCEGYEFTVENAAALGDARQRCVNLFNREE